MNPHKYLDLKKAIIDAGYKDDIQWAENVKPCEYYWDFYLECIFVICNSGMKAQIARKIFDKICKAIATGNDISKVFGHKGKVSAIKTIYRDREKFFQDYLDAKDKLEFCKSLPWIGDITKYHLYKNLGGDCVKPDRHLVRIAETYNTDCFTMCQKLSDIIGDRVGTVDYVIWRAANLRMI